MEVGNENDQCESSKINQTIITDYMTKKIEPALGVDEESESENGTFD
jgi:hypothetical protein